MAEILTFEELRNGNIFQTGYDNLIVTGNSEIEFKMQPQAAGGIAVIYAPNGTGKTSLSDVLDNMQESTDKMFIAKYNNQQITRADGKFHVIKDQINRNVIPGETADYLIGANIRREYELKKEIANGFTNAFNQLAKNFKSVYKVSKIGDYLISRLPIPDAVEYVKDIVNAKKRGKGIDKDKFIEFIANNEQIYIPNTADADKMNFIINDYTGAKVVEKILSITIGEIIANAEIAVIEQNDDAIKILNKYDYLCKCVVCDNEEYDATCLLEKKKKNRERIYENLDAKTKALLDDIINDISLREKDPFKIKKDRVTEFITDGNTEIIQSLRQDIELSISYVTGRMLNDLLNCFEGTNMLNDFAEYSKILETQPQIDSEELLFIQEIISENIGPEITIVRDEENDKNFKLMLEGKEFLGVERKQLHLSTGEQNFISLAFELLLARRTDKEFVVLDDPISSFDSVYKNKIAFCIIKFLENKKQIVLTHNTDLIRLLEVQQNGCFNMYLFNNTENGNNGFIRINNEEKDILINLYKLIKLFQNQDNSLGAEIKDKRQFLMAMIPFMRGYAHISKDGDKIYTSLSKIMHGYEEGSVDAAEIYNELFGNNFASCNISVDDILSLDCSDIDILNKERYPLLAETLKQTLIYYLRMKVEKELVDIFHVSIRPHHPLKLNEIIRKTLGYNANDEDAEKKREYKVFFTSRKTLLNEFNHFEGNMNIFQPAIDIESGALQKEIGAIEEKLIQLRKDYA